MANSQLVGSYLPALEWSAGLRLRFVFGLSDPDRARYWSLAKMHQRTIVTAMVTNLRRLAKLLIPG